MGHCGRQNIRISWIFVKSCLILTYLGQGAWLLGHKGEVWSSEGANPFYGLMPQWFLLPGIIIATITAIIASQAMISASFTLISEAVKLNVWPKLKINYPTIERGQIFIPGINLLLFAGCVVIVLVFQKSSRMEAAYGLAITLCMMMTSALFAYYMFIRRVPIVWIAAYLIVFPTIEMAFLIANLEKFPHGGYMALIAAGALFLVMLIWFKARKIKNRYVEFVRLEDYVPIIQELSNDRTIPKYSTHLVYLTSANNPKEIEHKIIFSILYRKPKRADIYWFVHVDVLDDPYTMEYVVQTIIPNEIIRVEFRLGFRVEHRIQMMFRKVVEEMVQNKEVNIVSRYESLSKNNVMGDFRFIIMEKFLSRDNELPFLEKLMMRGYFILKKISLSEERAFGLDSSDVTLEKYPIIVSPISEINLKRLEDE
jgi:KUP system potassium uptake protein